MAPILDGAPGFVLLTLSVGIGAYVRQVYVAASEIYDKVNGGELERFWPIEAPYTRDRLKNLLFVQSSLRVVTAIMFFFISVSSLRLVVSAANAIKPLVTDVALYYYDLFLVVYITLAFLVMWWTHWLGSRREHSYHVAMRRALKDGRSQSN